MRLRIFYSCLLWVWFLVGKSQTSDIESIATALRSGSAKELIKFCVPRVEIEIEGQKANYSKSQAEAVLRDFFNKNSARGFRYVHQGSSPEDGLKYAIGNYSSDGTDYRVYMLLKSEDTSYFIDTISFTKG